MLTLRALGARLHKPTTKDWPKVDWAVIGSDQPRVVLAHGGCLPPRGYSEPEALRHLHESIAAAVQENEVTKTLVWSIEGNARMNNAMRPRLRSEGVVVAAAAMMGSAVSLVGWQEIAALADAKHSKDHYVEARDVCGVSVQGADSQAVLAAIAALAS